MRVFVDTEIKFEFSGKTHGLISASTVQDLPHASRLIGPDTDIIIREKLWNPAYIEIDHEGQRVVIDHQVKGNGFEYQIDHFSNLVILGKTESDILNMEKTSKVLSLMGTAFLESGYGYLSHPAR